MSIILILCTILGFAFADDCVISQFEDVENAVKSCSDLVINSMSVPSGKTLDIKLNGGARLTFEGTTKFGVANWTGPLLKITGDGITVNGAAGSMLDGQGANYWDTKGSGSDSTNTKPKFFTIEATGGSSFNNIQMKNCPVHCVSIKNSDHLTLDRWNIDVSEGDKLFDTEDDSSTVAHNTDGFDVSYTTNLLIQNSNVFNQDDCVAVNRGSNMTFYKMYCSGGHGLSLSVGLSASDGDENTAANITFLDSTVVKSRNAIHVKTHNDGGHGEIRDVTYRNIRFSGSTNYGINIQEDYADGHSTGIPKGNIPIKNLVFDNVEGEVESGAVGVYIFCGDGGCLDWKWSNVNVTGQEKNDCNYEPSGFNC